MKNRGIKLKACVFCIIAILTIISLLAACSQKGTTTSSAKPQTSSATSTSVSSTTKVSNNTASASTTAASGKWWDKFGTPKYGGEIAYVTNILGDNFDPYNFFTANFLMCEQLFMGDITIDRNEFSYKTNLYPPKINGLLAESWEFTDGQTLVIHLHQGIKWQNKAPTNGRDFVAQDVVYHYNRALALGDGFTQPSPFAMGMLGEIAGVSASDKYTVVMKFKTAHQLINWWTALNPACPNMIESREQVETGHPSDMENAAGTGPFMPKDFVAGSSITWVKNQDYYLKDERYPGKSLPYIDTLKEISIMDPATALAAIRSGQVDFLDNITWQNADKLKSTNPDLLLSMFSTMGQTCDPRLDKKPFDDIRVRKALQLAINIPAIAKSIYGGYASSDPPGYIVADAKGWTRPYKDWPADLQQEYTYNPAEAKKLLAEAGYPDGFETNILIQTVESKELYEVIKAMLADIGVKMEINSMDRPQWMAYTQAAKHDQMTSNFFTNQVFPVDVCYNNRTSRAPTNVIYAPAADAKTYDDMFAQFSAAPDEATAKKLAVQMEEFIYRQHWAIITTGNIYFSAAQPEMKGYSGENLGGFVPSWFFSRFWKSN